MPVAWEISTLSLTEVNPNTPSAYWKIIAGNGVFLIYGNNRTDYYTSTDGKNWTQRTAPNGWSHQCFVHDRFMMTTDGWGWHYSFDGVSWQDISNPPNKNLSTIVYFKGKWWGVEYFGDYYSSTDLQSWTLEGEFFSVASTSSQMMTVNLNDEVLIYFSTFRDEAYYTYDGTTINRSYQPWDANRGAQYAIQGDNIYSLNGYEYYLAVWQGNDWVTTSNLGDDGQYPQGIAYDKGTFVLSAFDWLRYSVDGEHYKAAYRVGGIGDIVGSVYNIAATNGIFVATASYNGAYTAVYSAI